MTRRIRGILFDFNGTLFFDSRMHMDAFAETCRRYSKEPFSDEYMINNVFGRTNTRIFKENFKADATDLECEVFNDVKKKLYFDACLSRPERMHLVDGAAQMLDYLSANSIPFALATGSDREELDFFMEHLGLGRWFDFDKNIVFTDGSFRGKPEPDCYILAAEKIGLIPEECAVFEDGRSGIAAAHAAGCTRVVAISETGIPAPFDSPDEVTAAYNSLSDWRNALILLGL